MGLQHQVRQGAMPAVSAVLGAIGVHQLPAPSQLLLKFTPSHSCEKSCCCAASIAKTKVALSGSIVPLAVAPQCSQARLLPLARKSGFEPKKMTVSTKQCLKKEEHQQQQCPNSSSCD